MADLASDLHGIGAWRHVVAAAALGHRAGDAEIGRPVGHARDLCADAARGEEGGVRRPQRTAAAEARDVNP